MREADKTRYYLQYILLRVYLAVLGVLPFKMRVRVSGWFLGTVISRFPEAKRRIDSNLTRIFPEMSGEDREALRRKIGINIGRTYTEILNAKSYDKHPELIHVSGDGLDVIHEQMKIDKGVIFVSGHFGQWIAPRHYLNAIGANIGVVYRPSNNEYFDRIFVPAMAVAGPAIFGRGRGLIDMIRHVRGNGMVAILIDQKYSSGKRMKFMGHDAMTSTSAAEIALKYKLPLIPVYGVRRAEGLDVDVIFEAPIPPSDAITMTQAANDSLDARVRANPEQWYWLHQRWKVKKKKK